jgi:hypothetical protein
MKRPPHRLADRSSGYPDGAAALLLALACLAACDRADGPSCEAVAAQVDKIARADAARLLDPSAGTNRELRQTIGALLDATRGMVLTACRDDDWPAATRACFGAAADPDGLRACRAALPAPLAEAATRRFGPSLIPSEIRLPIGDQPLPPAP